RHRLNLILSVPLQNSVIQIDLDKPPKGSLGFALVGGNEGSALRVKAISPSGVAHRDGRLQIGDSLLQVNGENILGLSHSRAVEILCSAQGNVRLIISRDLSSHKKDNHPEMKSSFKRADKATRQQSEGRNGGAGDCSEVREDLTAAVTPTHTLGSPSLGSCQTVPNMFWN
uniref:PDZ domain-containing protein n=1 Tax=Callorhinchus milii TaxID=7868 RepID=A0A4W3GU78_CALMI